VTEVIGSVQDRVPAILYQDAEGSSDPNYIENIFDGRVDPKELFGVKAANGEWKIRGKVRYENPPNGESCLDMTAAFLRKIPDKVYLQEKWWYSFENTNPNRKLVGDKYNKKLFQKHNKFFVPAEDGSMQALILIDSYPNLVPERIDEDEGGAGLGAQARMFAEHFPKIKGKLRRKRATLIGINQVREKPMVAYGDPTYEPGGNALKFNSDCRLRLTPRSVPHGKGPIEEENSVLGEGLDKYRYIHIKTIKNKLATPYLDGWLRLWVTDAAGQGRGFCKVWDTFQYLKMTGQATGTMKKLHIDMPGFKTKKPLTWDQFKSLILLRGTELKKFCKSLKLKEVPRLRRDCYRQMASGDGMNRYFNSLRKEKEDDDEED
jgi:RecA/RadA recombinase